MTRWLFVVLLAVAAAIAGYLRFFAGFQEWWLDTLFVSLLAATLIGFIIQWRRILHSHGERASRSSKL